jgi:hypothetical protein
MFALHAAVPAAAAAVSADSPGRRHRSGGNQPGDGLAERLPADGAPLGDTFNLYCAVLCCHWGRIQ